ncbi:MAG: hypothetical protein KGJ77_04225 [Acidobacteriota bacterium]|nr:hypothetical protein [Acidobacteriota bacterium]
MRDNAAPSGGDERHARRDSARCGALGLLASVLGTLGLLIGSAPPAFANTAAPSSTGGTEVVDASSGHVTVTVTGTWSWPYTSLHAKVKRPCDGRVGVGWSIAWQDPNDKGYRIYYPRLGKYSARLGATGSDGLNAPQQVLWDPADPCGTFTVTNVPKKHAGNVSGTWSGTHTYKSANEVPPTLCAVMFDLAFRPGPKPSRLLVTNRDNTIHNALKHGGTYSSLPGSNGCQATSTFNVSTSPGSPPGTTPTTPPPTVPTSPAGPVPATMSPAPPAATQPSGPLAFTGLGAGGQAVAVAGAALVLVGGLLLLAAGRRRWALSPAAGGGPAGVAVTGRNPRAGPPATDRDVGWTLRPTRGDSCGCGNISLQSCSWHRPVSPPVAPRAPRAWSTTRPARRASPTSATRWTSRPGPAGRSSSR